MQLKRLTDLTVAIELYLSADEWTTYNHYGLSEQTAAASLTAPNSCWRYVVRDDGEILGLVGLENINALDKVAEPSIVIYDVFQRKGYGTQAYKKLCFDLGVNEIGLRRLQATALSGAPSIKMLEAVGFKCEGVLKKLRFKHGEFIDGLLYAWVEGDT